MRAGNPLEMDPFRGHVEPAVQHRIVRKELAHLRVGARNVLWIARQCCPAERTLAAAEERADVGRHETRVVERVLDSGVLRLLADVVAVVDARDAQRLESEDRAHVIRDRFTRRKCDLVGLALAQVLPLLQRPMLGKVTVRRIVRRSLVGDQSGRNCVVCARLQQLRHELRRIAEQADRDGATFAGCLSENRRGFVDRSGLRIQVAGLEAHRDPRRIAFDREHRGTGHRRGKRLGAAHSAEARGENPFPRPVAAVVLAARSAKRLVGALTIPWLPI
jgi:hypothetical protein